MCIKSGRILFRVSDNIDRSGIGSATNETESVRFNPKRQKISEEKVEDFKKNASNKLQDKKIYIAVSFESAELSLITKIKKMCSQLIINLDEQAGKDPEANPLLADWFMTERIRDAAEQDPTIQYISFEDLIRQETPTKRLFYSHA